MTEEVEPRSENHEGLSANVSAINITSSSKKSSNNTISHEVITSKAYNPLVIGSTGRVISLVDVAKLLREKTKYSEVTLEQIDRVREMHDKFASSASFSFNYNTLLFVASILAGLGLVQGSSTTIIASMLVSPIMGPVVGMAYAATIHDWKLLRNSFKVELLSLLVCVAMGLLIGACTGWTDLAQEWPTQEMMTRATMQNFWVALPVAFFSGLGVAVSLLDEQTSSLVGVAISASLLPPAVNAGILWVAYGFFEKKVLGDEHYVEDLPDPATLRQMFRHGGGVSLGLTIVNVVLIIISSMLMFRLKERLPIEKKIFWEDLAVARKVYMNRAILADTSFSDSDAEASLGPHGSNCMTRIAEEK